MNLNMFLATPTPMSMQINSVEPSHIQFPPMGYQLARDPITSHLFLIPTANLGMMTTFETQDLFVTVLSRESYEVGSFFPWHYRCCGKVTNLASFRSHHCNKLTSNSGPSQSLSAFHFATTATTTADPSTGTVL